MKKSINYLFIVLMSLFLYGSCNNNKNRTVSHKNSEEVEEENNGLQIKYLFPDTVHQNKSYGGFIIFESSFDSVTTKMFGNAFNREVVLELEPDINYTMDKKFYVDSLSVYRLIAYDNRRIPFYNVSFHTLGTFYLKGKIKDSYLVDNKICDSCLTEVAIQKKFINKIVVVK